MIVFVHVPPYVAPGQSWLRGCVSDDVYSEYGVRSIIRIVCVLHQLVSSSVAWRRLFRLKIQAACFIYAQCAYQQEHPCIEYSNSERYNKKSHVCMIGGKRNRRGMLLVIVVVQFQAYCSSTRCKLESLSTQQIDRPNTSYCSNIMSILNKYSLSMHIHVRRTFSIREYRTWFAIKHYQWLCIFDQAMVSSFFMLFKNIASTYAQCTNSCVSISVCISISHLWLISITTFIRA